MTEQFDQPVTTEQVGQVLDFASPGIEPAIAQEQLYGTTALYNILCRERVAYLADEVGMGKTYQALGIIALTWFVDPSANILVITPRKAVQQKWNRDYRNFVATNIQLADNRLKDPILDRPVHPRCFCKNLVELGKEVCRNPRQLFLTRLSSYSWVARSLGVLDSDQPRSGREISEALRGEGLYVDPTKSPEKHFEGSTEQNVEVARQMAQLLPRFDLVVVDEAQKLRNKGSNIRTQVLNTLLGFYPWTDAADVDEQFEAPPRLLLLSATPAHRSEGDIYRQLSYASTEALEVAERNSQQRQTFLERVMVRRLRKLAGHSKYDYRREKPVVWERDDLSPRRVLDELFVAYVQRELQSALDRDSVGTQLEVGFLETFESYEPSDLDDDGGDNDTGDDSSPSTHYEAEDDTVAPDHRVLSEIAEKFGRATDSGLPPHPKQRLVDDAARQSFESDRPEKILIFVRRLASVRELTRRICRVYDDVTLRRLSDQIGAERIRRRVGPRFDFDRFETAEQFRTYADIVLGKELEDAALESPDDQRDDDAVAQSEVLDVMSRSTDELTPGERLLNRLVADNSLAPVFEENLVRLLFRQLHAPANRADDDEEYHQFCDRVCDASVRATFNSVLQRDRTDAERGENTRYFASNQSAKPSRIRTLLYQLVLLRASSLYPDNRLVSELLRIHREIHGHRCELDEPRDNTGRFDDYIDDALVHRSFWDIATEKRRDLKLVALLRGDPPYDEAPDSWLEYREFIKRLVEKNFRVSDAVLHLFVAYDRAGGADAQNVAHHLADIIFGDEGVRTRYRIESLLEQGSALETLAGGQLDSDTPLYAESRWKDFDRQQPALGATGGTSSRYPVIVKFNAPFFPDFVVATDVFREGVDLHMSCRRVWHFGMVANPGDVEQRSGRIDRYFSKVHRALRDDTTPQDEEGQLHIEYPFLAKTIDEQQVARVLKRKLEVQPLMDKGLSVSEELRLALDERADQTAHQLLNELSQLDAEDTTPFPVAPHLEKGRYLKELRPTPHPSAKQLADWLASTFRRLEDDIPLTQAVADGFSTTDHDGIRGLPALTEMAFARRSDDTRRAGSSADTKRRKQPVEVDIRFIAATGTHILRLTTPLGNHDASTAAALQNLLHTEYADSALRLHFDPDQSGRRRHWRLAACTDLPIFDHHTEWPSANRVAQKLLELAEITADFQSRLEPSTDADRDLNHDEVHQ